MTTTDFFGNRPWSSPDLAWWPAACRELLSAWFLALLVLRAWQHLVQGSLLPVRFDCMSAATPPRWGRIGCCGTR
jgi:hypothetical protein